MMTDEDRDIQMIGKGLRVYKADSLPSGKGLVGFRLLAGVCGKQSRKPTVCYHPDNPGTLGHFGCGGKCVKTLCPVWRNIQKANVEHQRRANSPSV